MRRQRYLIGLATAAVTALALAAPGAQAAPVTKINFGGTQDIIFSPDGGFTFGDDTGAFDDFVITSQEGGTGTGLAGLKGEILGSFSFADPGGNPTAPVTTASGALTIWDGAAGVTAPIELTLIGEGAPGFETTAAILGTIDFSGSTYTGSNADLMTLVTQGAKPGDPVTITFQTVGVPIELDEVYDNGGNFSYSGTIGASFTEGEVPEPATLGLIGAGLLGLGVIGRRRKAAA